MRRGEKLPESSCRREDPLLVVSQMEESDREYEEALRVQEYEAEEPEIAGSRP